MKKNTLSKGLVAAWLIATVMAFTACSSEDSTMEYIQAEASAEVVTKAAAASNPYSIVLKAFSNNKDITTKGDVDSVTLFVFDENYDYVETRTIDKATVLNRRT
ncbi:FimB/Mfa2 family fimbrial subunit, partial [Parabacteroides sp. PF5-6]